MFEVILRASARSFDPDDFLDRHALEAENVWHAGELGPGGRVRPESGFALTIAHAPTPNEIVTELRSWMEIERDTLRALGESSVQPVIEARIRLPSDPALSASLTFEASDLAALAAMNVALRITASHVPAS